MLLLFVYWSTAGYLLRQADETIEAEIAGLAERYQTGGLVGLTTLIDQRLARQQPTVLLSILSLTLRIDRVWGI
ncbi:MAG: hypothetical protein Ct9H300mP25_09660 [Acidobacteriota bacterium]|nr:MAG: hypothetical protein Ct9H300mP25_09660 [Acidobacteriota bacterium]